MAQNKNYKGNRNNKGQSRNNDKRPPKDQQRPPKGQQRPPNDKGQEGSKKEDRSKGKPSKPSSNNDLLWFSVVMILVAGSFLFNRFYLAPKRVGIHNPNYKGPPFRKEGSLSFIDAQAKHSIIKIDVEIANTIREQNTGLMNRRFLPANGGMLYTYKESGPKTFSMQNIYLSLDVLFINSDQEITRIVEERPPLSVASIPSGGKVQYMLLVQGGFCKAFNIRVGDRIEY